jgi:hypothetical protein
MPILCYAISEHKGCQVPIGYEMGRDETGHSVGGIEARSPGDKKPWREADIRRAICYNNGLHCAA